jgi:2-polyprenyl-3-methyl-5-hydroxy-6-metoxy-1,4-benzoquinol methylase
MIYNKENWEEMYKTKFTPWDAKNPDPNLVRVVDGGCIKPCKTIDLGCGTGNESLFMSSKGFTVTGIDISEIAIKEAQEKAKKRGCYM